MMLSEMDTDLAYCGVGDADAVVDSERDADLGVMVVVDMDAVVDSVRLFQYSVAETLVGTTKKSRRSARGIKKVASCLVHLNCVCNLQDVARVERDGRESVVGYGKVAGAGVAIT